MKVAVLSFHSFERVKGGTELFCEHLRTAFPDLTLFTYEDVRPSALPRLDRLNLEEARMGVAISRLFSRELERNGFDLTICNSTAGWWLSAGRTDIPMLNVFHYTMKGLAEGTLRGTSGYLPSRYFLPLFEKAAARGKGVLAVSEKVRRELAVQYRIQSKVIENGIDLERFRPRDRKDSREMLGLPSDGPIALFVGRADHTKGFDIVREVARLRLGLRVVCVTSNDVRGGNMIVRHDVPNHLLPSYYSAADLLLLPSRYESFGYTALEAMACGLPVVATRTGILEDLEDGHIGEVVPSADPSLFLRAVDRALKGTYDPRPVVGARFSLQRFAEQYRSAAEDAVAEHEGRARKEARLAAPAR